MSIARGASADVICSASTIPRRTLRALFQSGRLRVPVPDGLEKGEEMTAVCPDGRRVPLRLPEGGGDRQGRSLEFFIDLPKLIWAS